MRVAILASGSKGNATLFESGQERVIVDAGIAAKRVVEKMQSLGIKEPLRASALIITHSHSDHGGHATRVARKLKLPVYAAPQTLAELKLPDDIDAKPLPPELHFGGLRVRARRIPHDVHQVALRFTDATDDAALVTDLGHIPEYLVGFLAGVRTLLLEANHDRDMLRCGPYPERLKRRVGGDFGHISNGQCAALLRELASDLEDVLLMHLSEHNNSPKLALEAAKNVLLAGTRLRVASQKEPMTMDRSITDAVQLSLALG